MYECKDKLYSGTGLGMNTLDTWGKPFKKDNTGSGPKVGELLPNQEMAWRRNIYLWHIIGVSSLFVVLGICLRRVGTRFESEIQNDSDTPNRCLANIKIILLFLVFSAGFHGVRVFVPRDIIVPDDCFDTKEQKEIVEKREIEKLRVVYGTHAIGLGAFAWWVWFSLGRRNIGKVREIGDMSIGFGVVAAAIHSLLLVVQPNICV